jgi:hypothetical protein
MAFLMKSPPAPACPRPGARQIAVVIFPFDFPPSAVILIAGGFFGRCAHAGSNT